MADVSNASFPSPIIAQTYLSHATPETVYAWLRANAGEIGPLFTSPLSDELLKALLDRNDPIINLAIASVAAESEILRRLWKSGDRANRSAIAGNKYRDQGIAGILNRHSWAEPDELSAALQDDSGDFVRLWCANPALHFIGLREAFAREGIYEKLSDERWLAVVYWALPNPNLTVRDDRFDDGTDYPAYQAAWTLLLTLPNTRTNAYLLGERYSKLNIFAADYESLLDEKPANILTEREKWQEQQRQGEIRFLRHVFEKWTAAASDDPSARDKEGNEAHEFQTLRQDVAAAVANRGNDVQDLLKNNQGVYVRRGYYRAGRLSNPAELQALFERDGKDFLEPAIYNENLYTVYPKGIRATFRQIAEDSPRYEDYPVPSFRSIWDYQAAQLFKRDPAHYPDPNIFEDDALEQAPVDEAAQSDACKAGRIARTAGRWTWRVAKNVFYALVVWYVLSQVHGHPESVIVPVLGLIYVALRSGGISLGQITLQQGLALDAIYEKLRSMSDASYTRQRSEIEAIERLKFRITGDIIIESLSLSIISLICLWFLYNAL